MNVFGGGLIVAALASHWRLEALTLSASGCATAAFIVAFALDFVRKNDDGAKPE
jgi:hypothetical protein